MFKPKKKPDHGAYIVGTRIEERAYDSMLTLMGAAGYEDVSTFVRSAVLTKCQDISSGMADLHEIRVIDNKRCTYSPLVTPNYSRITSQLKPQKKSSPYV